MRKTMSGVVAMAAVTAALVLASTSAAEARVSTVRAPGGNNGVAMAAEGAQGAGVATPIVLAADGPKIYPGPGGSVRGTPYKAPDEAWKARYHVHAAGLCGDAICTIQRYGGNYWVFEMSGCATFFLENFYGRWDTHNHGTEDVRFYDASGKVIGVYAGGRDDVVDWTPIHAVKTCQ